MENFNQDQLEEIEKLLKYIKQMESIVRTSPNAEQVSRVRKELKRYREKVAGLVSGIDANRFSVEEVREKLGISSSVSSSRSSASSGDVPMERSILEKFPEQKASAHCNDVDVNFLATVLKTIQKEYWPAISDTHCKMDFSHSAERDALRTQLDNALRSLKILGETIEEYATAEKQDFREQLLKMKNKQSRVFLFETNDTLKKIREFLGRLADDIRRNGGSILNKGDIIEFDPKYEDATALHRQPVDEGILEFEEYVKQAIAHLRLPQMK